MVTKLKLLLRSQILQSALKALIFGGFLYWLLSAGSWAAALFFVLAACWLYFRPIFNSAPLASSLFLLLIISFMTVLSSVDQFWGWLAVLFLSFLFFLIVSLKNYVLLNRKFWYSVFNFSLIYLVYLNFFLADRSSLFFTKWLLALALVFWLFRELSRLVILESGRKIQRLTGVISALFAFIVAQLLLAVSWLPIGFLNSANLLMLFTFLAANLSAYNYSDELGKRVVVKNLLLFIFLLAVILLTSSWSV